MIKMTTHKLHRDYMKEQLKLNHGHCPCQIPQSDDTICPCKNFREEVEEGWCICELFEKIPDEN